MNMERNIPGLIFIDDTELKNSLHLIHGSLAGQVGTDQLKWFHTNSQE